MRIIIETAVCMHGHSKRSAARVQHCISGITHTRIQEMRKEGVLGGEILVSASFDSSKIA